MAFIPPLIVEIETKLAAARTRLILEKPFLGTLVMHLPLKRANPETCPRTATDARAFYYNPEYIHALNLSQTQFVLAHEALHCALGHFARRQHRTRRRWDVACEYAVNIILVDDGLKPPIGALINEEYRSMTAEEIYPLLPEDTNEEPMDRHAYDEGEETTSSEDEPGKSSNMPNIEQWLEEQKKKGAGEGEQSISVVGEEDEEGEEQEVAAAGEEPRPLSEEEKETLLEQWRTRLASAAQQARMAGRLGDSIARMFGDLLQPQLPWRMLLARYMKTVARDDYSFQRLSRREGDALMPSLRSGQVEMVIVLDSSGSIDNGEMQEFVSEVDALKGEVNAKVTLHACDDKLCPEGPWIYEAWDYLRLPENITGGGGTSFVPIFEWVEQEGLHPDLLLYFTDADGEFPKQEPVFPVIWLVKGKQEVPWGERIQLN